MEPTREVGSAAVAGDNPFGLVCIRLMVTEGFRLLT